MNQAESEIISKVYFPSMRDFNKQTLWRNPPFKYSIKIFFCFRSKTLATLFKKLTWNYLGIYILQLL